MRSDYLFLICLIFLSYSCGGPQKSVIGPDETDQTSDLSKAEMIPEKLVDEPIKIFEEKLVPVNNLPPDPSRYFVIIGSFRNPDNAGNYQKQIELDGFSSELLKNEEGLYRVSVLATDVMLDARREIKRIRENYPKYSDTWLLIQKR